MNGPRQIVVLGSTGSIGASSLDVMARFPDRFVPLGLAAGRNMTRLAEQARHFHPRFLAVRGPAETRELTGLLGNDWSGQILEGPAGPVSLAAHPEADTVVSAIVGAAGLPPTWAAVRAGKRVALANKETMVMAGELVMAEAQATGAQILPVDSEHSAIFQALAGQRIEDVKRLILTASGGPFWNRPSIDLAQVTPEAALAHPQWRMGAKISIDSATLMNKGLEIIEARWLFGLPWDKIAIHIHPQSIVHSLVEFVDGSVLAQLGRPDMRLPIAYALSYPERLPLNLPGLDLPRAEALTFADPDPERFPCLALALEAGRRGGAGPAVLSAANEVAVQAFLDGELPFSRIPDLVAEVMRMTRAANGDGPLTNIAQALTADHSARKTAAAVLAGYKGEQSAW